MRILAAPDKFRGTVTASEAAAAIAAGTPANQIVAKVGLENVPSRLVAEDAITDLTELGDSLTGLRPDLSGILGPDRHVNHRGSELLELSHHLRGAAARAHDHQVRLHRRDGFVVGFEHVPDGGHPLPGGGLGQVVVAVPLGLAGGVRDQLEDDAGRRVDVTGRGHDAVLGGGQGGLVEVLHGESVDPDAHPPRASAGLARGAAPDLRSGPAR